MPLESPSSFKPGDRCPTCHLTHCNCIRCGICRERVPRKATCDKCKMCAKHHDGYYPKDFPHRTCKYDSAPKADNTFAINPLHRSIGVELELGVFAPMAGNGGNAHINWSMHHDGSVQGSGQELVTDPMIGDRYIFGMARLIQDLTNGGSATNNSCGYHVHVDAAEMAPFDLRRIMVAFQLVQKSLYGTLVDVKRETSSWGLTYCPPLNCDPAALMVMEDKNEFINWLHLWLYQVKLPAKSDYVGADNTYKEVLREIDAQLKHFKGTKYMNRARRWALNFHSWMMRGTMEFRLKEMTMDPGDIIMWPLWCAWFVEKFGNASDKDIHYFMKKGLPLSAATEFMMSGTHKMPLYVGNWVNSKI